MIMTCESLFAERNAEFPRLVSFGNWELIAGYLSLSILMFLADVCTDVRQATNMFSHENMRHMSSDCCYFL